MVNHDLAALPSIDQNTRSLLVYYVTDVTITMKGSHRLLAMQIDMISEI